MKPPPVCPRCGGPLREPGPWSSDWLCASDGAVLPFWLAAQPGSDMLAALCATTDVPVWVLWPLPRGWLVTGLAHVGDDRSGPRAVAVALSGPAPFGGPGDLLLIAEEPGVGLGAGYAGLAGPDPGGAVGTGLAPAHISAGGRPTPLWSIDARPDTAVYAGEAMGLWLWVILWPAEAGLLLADDLVVVDARSLPSLLDVPFGAPSPRLTQPPPQPGR